MIKNLEIVAGVAKRLRPWIVVPVCAGSNPVICPSSIVNNSKILLCPRPVWIVGEQIEWMIRFTLRFLIVSIAEIFFLPWQIVDRRCYPNRL